MIDNMALEGLIFGVGEDQFANVRLVEDMSISALKTDRNPGMPRKQKVPL